MMNKFLLALIILSAAGSDAARPKRASSAWSRNEATPRQDRARSAFDRDQAEPRVERSESESGEGSRKSVRRETKRVRPARR